MSEEIKEIPLKERIEKLLESGWVNEFNYLESQLQEARSLVVILQQKVEQLENIRKEAIEYVYKHIQEYDVDGTFTNLDEFDFIASPQTLLNILNKGDNNGRK